MRHYDVIIIGSGVAGLYAAVNLPTSKKVLVISKSHPWECNTYYAQGGITTAYNDDDIASHMSDTIEAGAFMCDESSVSVLSHSSQGVISDLIERGFEFDRDEDGELLYTKEAAHSRSRILHAGGDATGRYLHFFLLNKNPHQLLSDAMVTDLLIDNGVCYGVEVFSDGVKKLLYATDVIIASGGVGGLYEYHTNASTISAELQGIAIEKSIELESMEMMQFHPTVFVANSWARKQLLTEALRGEGAHIVDENGYRFLFEYDSRGELAPRDVVSRAIYDYKQKSKKEIFLSCEHFEVDYFRERFPNIYKSLKDIGYILPKDRVPISPAFHYAIGGIKTGLYGEIAGIEGLYAVGEVASTRVHGANRLASNSLLEGLVFSARVARDIVSKDRVYTHREFHISDEALELESDKELKDRLRVIMWDYLSIKRTSSGMIKAHKEIEQMLSYNIGRMLKLRLLVAREMISSAINRKESIGVHYIEN